MKKINGVLIALLMVMGLSIISVQGEDIETVTLYSDFQNEEQLMKQVNDMLQNNPYAHVQVLDEAYKDNIILPKEGN